MIRLRDLRALCSEIQNELLPNCRAAGLPSREPRERAGWHRHTDEVAGVGVLLAKATGKQSAAAMRPSGGHIRFKFDSIMKTKTLIHALLVCFALSFHGFAADQANPADPVPRNAVPAAAERPFSGKIAAIDITSRIVTLSDANKNSPTLRIGDRTRITKGGAVARWENLTVGTMIEGVCIGDGSDAFATVVNIK